MRIADRIASWFGYVPLTEALDMVVEAMRDADKLALADRLESKWTQTSVVTPPQTVVVSADFKRNKLCS